MTTRRVSPRERVTSPRSYSTFSYYLYLPCRSWNNSVESSSVLAPSFERRRRPLTASSGTVFASLAGLISIETAVNSRLAYRANSV